MDTWMIYVIIMAGAAIVSYAMVKYGAVVIYLRKKAQKALDYLNSIEDSVPSTMTAAYTAAVQTLTDFLVVTLDNKISYGEAVIMINDAMAIYHALKAMQKTTAMKAKLKG